MTCFDFNLDLSIDPRTADIIVQALTWAAWTAGGTIYGLAFFMAMSKLREHVRAHGWREGLRIWNYDV